MTFSLRPSTVLIQKKLLNIYYHNPKMALLTVSTGGGKTYGAIHTFGTLLPNATLLVFTTSKVALSKQWQNSIKDYNQTMSTNLKYIVYNYDKLVSQRFLDTLFKKLNFVSNEPIVLILDEVHRIKLAGNGKLSKRSKLIMKLAKQKYITTTLGLSATAFTNSYLDVAPYLIIAGYYRNKTEFMNKRVKRFDDYYQPIVTDYTGQISRNAFYDPDSLDREIASITAYVDTSVYKPDLITFHELFDLNKNERYGYNQFKRDYDEGIYEYPIQARMAQERYLSVDLAYHKDLYLLKILQMRKKGVFDKIKTPVLIFYQYSSVYWHLLNLLKVCYPEYDIVSVNGFSKSNLSKPANNDSIYLVQYEAGGEGLDWQWSNLSIFYEAPVRYEKFVQAKGRNVRNRSEMKQIYHYEFEYKNTLDGDRWDTNRSKKDFTKDVSERTFLTKKER